VKLHHNNGSPRRDLPLMDQECSHGGWTLHTFALDVQLTTRTAREISF
jgi:hypothetical protein